MSNSAGEADGNGDGGRLHALVVGSMLLALGGALGDAADRAVEHASVTAGFRTLGRWLRGSWLYAWLTAEPEPEVVVIDLRETYTVGPMIAALDWLAARVRPRWRDSTLRRLFVGVESRLAPVVDVLAASRVGALLHALFVPPEPPEEPPRERRERGDENSEED